MIVDPRATGTGTAPSSPTRNAWRADQGLVSALEREGVELVFAAPLDPPLFNGVFTRDPLVTVRGGAVVGRLAPRQRRGEEASIARALAVAGMPILRTVAGTGTVEGGSS